jgi:hypothetical protein
MSRVVVPSDFVDTNIPYIWEWQGHQHIDLHVRSIDTACACRIRQDCARQFDEAEARTPPPIFI